MAPLASFSFGGPASAAPAPASGPSTAAPAQPPLKESRKFNTDTYTIWASLQRIVQQYEADQDEVYGPGGTGVPPPAQVQYYGRVCRLYRDAILQQLPLIQNDAKYSPAGKAKALAHHATMHGILALAEVLYLPVDGVGEGLVSEELLDWINTIDPAPSNEEGTELLALASPWESDNFFPYLSRCVLRGHLASASALLSLVQSQHPNTTLQSLAQNLSALLTSYPRSTAFRTETAFVVALRQWRTQTLAPAKAQLDSQVASDDADEWSSALHPLVSLLSASTPSAAQQAIADLGAEDWRETLAAYCLWAAPASLRRADLPPLIDRFTRDQPIDPTLPAERAHAALLRGDVPEVLKALTGGLAWTAAHLGDLLSHLHLPAFDPPVLSAVPDRSRSPLAGADVAAVGGGLGLREAFLLDWGDRCTADPGLWRVSCEYWAACGAPGRDKVRALARALPLDDPEAAENNSRGSGAVTNGNTRTEVDGMEIEESASSEKENAAPAKKPVRQVDELLAILAALGLTEEFTSTCEAYAAKLVDKKRYGEAVAYAVRAADGRRIAEIADRILEEYIENGQAAFISHVDSIPTSLLRPAASLASLPPPSPSVAAAADDELPGLSPSAALAPFTARLTFLARYRDFFALYASGARVEAAQLLVLLLTSGVAPKRFWAVMLLDAVPLLEENPPLLDSATVFELLRVTEDLLGPPDVFGALDLLARLGSKGATRGRGDGEAAATAGIEAARQQMRMVRTALARALAACACAE